jgi:hypothetical protein
MQVRLRPAKAGAFSGRESRQGNSPKLVAWMAGVRREKALVNSGWKSRPGTGSFYPVTIEAVVEVTKPLKPSVKRVAKATR